MHIKLTSRLLRRHLNYHGTYFDNGTKKREMSHKKKRDTILDSNHGQLDQRNSNISVHLLRFLHDNVSDLYLVCVYTYE